MPVGAAPARTIRQDHAAPPELEESSGWAVAIAMSPVRGWGSQNQVALVAGERHRLRALTEFLEAQFTREVVGRPKGTVICLGTNSVEIILGPTNDLIQ